MKFIIFCFLLRCTRGFHVHRNQIARPKLVHGHSLPLSMVTRKHFEIIPHQWYENMVEWALGADSCDDSLPSTVVTVKPSSINKGNGLYAMRDFNTDEILFEIPSNKCLSVEQAWNHPTLGKYLPTMSEDSEEGSKDENIAVLATYLAYELLTDARAEFEGDSSLESTFSPYLKTLLTGVKKVTNHDHVLYWSDEEVDILFSGYSAYKKVVAMRKWAEDRSKVMLGLLANDLSDKGTKSISVYQISTVISLSLVSVLRRSFRDDDKGTNGDGRGLQMMVPVLDMAHYSHDPNIEFHITPTNSIVVQAKRDVKKGQELTIGCPTKEAQLQEDDFFIAVGFVPKKSPTFDYKKALQNKEMPPWLVEKILQS